jgi:stringent starvation protein B
MAESSTKPYLLRALHEWASDNGHTPHMVVQVTNQCRVPPAFVRDGQITLNVSHLATGGLVIGNDFIEFQARFGGKSENISVPVGAVTAIYARETGTGMGFEADETVVPASLNKDSTTKSPKAADVEVASPTEPADKPQRPSLRIVK